jgi:hypothetical protein
VPLYEEGISLMRVNAGSRAWIAALQSLLLLLLAGCAPARSASAGSTPHWRSGDWIVLFDGADLRHWRSYRQEDVHPGWRVENGELALVPGGEQRDLITRERFDDFELELEWRISPRGNTGIIYRVSEDHRQTWHTGPEMQILDNSVLAPGADPVHMAGANYALHAPSIDATRPLGEWNRVRLVARGPWIEQWMNGERVVAFEQWSDDWKVRVSRTKFREMPAYGRNRGGHIALQDHGDRVWFRDIRIRRLELVAAGRRPPSRTTWSSPPSGDRPGAQIDSPRRPLE